MTMIDQWPHRWFGVWREYGPSFEACPSVQSFVNRNVSARYDKARLRQYLTSAHAVLASSRCSFPCPFTGRRASGSICFRTDGRWLWLDDLADYIDQFDVAIPTAFLQDIEKNGYVPPPVAPDVMQQLEWPVKLRRIG